MPRSTDSGSGDVPVDDRYVYAQDDNVSVVGSTRTVATTTTSYRYENGRTYHAFRDGEYWQPNDAKHNNHEALIHHMCLKSLDDRLYLSPIKDPGQILDLGTGTGIWASDIADRFSGETDEYPYAEVIGTDLSPIQPGPHPPNCRFEIDDCCSEWVQPPASLGYVHIRGLYGSVADWPTLYQQAYRALRPGGWIEQTEWDMVFRGPDGRPTAHPVLAQWTRDCLEVGVLTGKSFEVAANMAGWVAAAGFKKVVERRFKWPLGPWCVDPKLKEIGRWNLLNWEEGLEGWTLALYTRVLGWSPERLAAWNRQIRAVMRDRNVQVYHEIRVVYAQKPEK